MNEERRHIDIDAVEAIFEDAGQHWQVNTGETTIHARRLPGMWRNIKWLSSSVWLLFLFGAYLRWDGRQAVLFDIPNRQFHIFNITILPQDFWMLSLVLLFFAILLAVATAIAGRVWCGYFCFQTVWTDIYTWIEEKLEGPPNKRRKLELAPWTLGKVTTKAIKHILWIAIALFTGISFVVWFTDAIEFWKSIFAFDVHIIAIMTIGVYAAFTYLFAGFMREQVCFWLCPYARIQGAMADRNTIMPTYDFERGEPRRKPLKGQDQSDESQGDCIDCNLCLSVCPTGVDIRNGQQEGCITCGLCLDACDNVMDKLNLPRGLIRYASLEDMVGKVTPKLYERTRVWIYGTIMSLALVGIVYGLSTIEGIELKILHERQPLFVVLSDGSIQNKYRLKVLNKTTDDLRVVISASGPNGLIMVDGDKALSVRRGNVTPTTVFLRLPVNKLSSESVAVEFSVTSVEDSSLFNQRTSAFFGPAKP